MSLLAPVSVGEFLDKLTILEIKSDRIKDPEKLDNIRHELHQLRGTWQNSDYADALLEPEYSRLKAVNEATLGHRGRYPRPGTRHSASLQTSSPWPAPFMSPTMSVPH